MKKNILFLLTLYCTDSFSQGKCGEYYFWGTISKNTKNELILITNEKSMSEKTFKIDKKLTVLSEALVNKKVKGTLYLNKLNNELVVYKFKDIKPNYDSLEFNKNAIKLVKKVSCTE